MQDLHDGEAQAVALGGRLAGIGLPDVLWALCQREATGILEITRRPVRRRLYLQGGEVVFAASSDPNDRFGELLLRRGTIRLDQLEEALGRQRSGKRVGALLVEAGALSSEGLVDALVGQIKSTVLDVLMWEEGDWRFQPTNTPTAEAITLREGTARILLEGIRRIPSFTRIRAAVGAPRTVYALAAEQAELRRGLDLTPAEQLIVERLGRGQASIEELCGELAVSSFEVHRTLWAFKVLGLARELEAVQPAPGGTGLRGWLNEEGFPEVLVRASRSGETGVLYVNRRGTQRSFHFGGGRCLFATSSDPDDGLISYLLRRGVISLRDREETVRRLLSNKRVGTLLQELGVIDEVDLRDMVRQHIEAIVCDTFRWDEGDYVFVAGELPSHEEIVLDADIAALVARGIRGISSWTRVIRGCGGVDHPLSLGPDYLAVLDAMGAGVTEWEVVGALKQPQTPRRVCRLVELGGFRVCQILWALKLLGAVVSAPLELDAALPLEAPEPARAAALPPPPAHETKAAVEPVAVEEPVVGEVRAALAALPATAPAVAPPPAAGRACRELPPDLDAMVERFNAMHRLIYRVVRAEVGAGAVNFVRSCSGQAADGSVDPLEEVKLHADGSWDADDLKQAVRDGRVEDPWSVYRRVLDREFALLAPHLDEGRSEELRRKIWEIEQTDVG